MEKIAKGLIISITVVLLTACARTAPIDTVRHTISANYTEAQVRNAIVNAGVQRQWVMTDIAPGVLKGRQVARDHIAEIRINYSAMGYTINYDSSTNLRASGGKIHKSYNRWVHNLDKDIQIGLSATSLKSPTQ